MRVNLPVTTQEYPFPRGETLVSTTDLQGRILYCNPMFVEVSGYERAELLGQPHNMIRHPDMPEEAFRDMWETIAAGWPWSAAVKNRRKDGTYYWVMANVTPLMEDGRPVGYMSVRTEASREQIADAEALYGRMRAEKQAGRMVHALQRGRVVRRTLSGRIRQALEIGLGGQVAMAFAAVWLAAFLAGLVDQESGMFSALAWLAAAGVALGGFAWVRRTAVLPLVAMVGAANRMAAGDLTQSVTVTRTGLTGELQRALAQLNVNLLSIVRDARQESDKMRMSSREIAQGNQELSSRTENQASNLQQTAASMEEITGTVKQTADSARQASELAQQATGVAERTSGAVEEVAATMREIQTSSGRIGEITGLIDSIAFQTNILALNAAVEAARAGEHGRGFAVVAAEVRSLSQRTQSAAKEIRQLIEESAARVGEGHARTDGARRTMQESLELVRRVGVFIGEIHSASNEQLSGISQVNAAVAQLDTITQQNAALVEESAALAIELERQAQTVSESVQVFRLDRGPRAAAPDAVALRKAAKAGRATAAALPALR
ncbi:methyl-accepting chemotaxis protein [Paracidovorax citrulli]|uniref:Methyl-accepting chemotaxis sensory transducer with Pas/Pac sensor n=2 Tax=Paracidovorax citrulli TaxID=80869 RepID=A1TP06_PARC0|nr:PAS domain-containing methyl-accepting chemotaxis protein [Paracidovorax citrulli]ABM32694.1 methyl-accepting chemotaxis sensory transducer with Pas/Pac sensor [Paracidovorax citrulli AAC00-1]ATG93308.1 chemotaxis protein [Paracidovorax citrulli]MVT28651.1 PAS domain-containing protein [Paracidovorax citrulli]PVY66911.1 methyl-accepting chemotaxis sensory transducer with Pas/Pac sensor [Paracidovorax citrulli]REG68926.1 methyl-accepting chemotaxis sensory transducer with Pas/Pac sensor [Par